MSRRTPRLGALPTALALLGLTGAALAGCNDTGPDPDSEAPSESGEPTRTQTPEPTTALLDWKPTGGSPEDRRIVGSQWTSLVDDAGRAATLTPDAGGDTVRVAATGPRQVSDVLMNDDWAVVIAEDPREGDPRREPTTATVVDLADGSTTQVTDPPPGASFALHDDRLLYATFDASGAYCVAEVDPATGQGDFTTCARPREGITRVTVGEHGVAWLSFDDQRPISCRTPLLADGASTTPVDEAADCSAWDVAAMPDGAVWSEVPNERRAEEGIFRAVADRTAYELGEGTTGTLVPCGDSTWFVSDPAGPRDPARLMRWTPDARLEVAYESRARGNAFVATPECAGDVLTVSAFGPRGGDEQVAAQVG